MKNYIEIKPTETVNDFMKGLTKTTRKVIGTDRDGWPIETTETIYRDENGNTWIVGTDRDGWLYKYMEN